MTSICFAQFNSVVANPFLGMQIYVERERDAEWEIVDDGKETEKVFNSLVAIGTNLMNRHP